MRRTRLSPGRWGSFGRLDLLSSNVGVLVILAGMVALTALIHPLGGQFAKPGTADAPASGTLAQEPRVLKVPWSRGTSKNPVFAALIGGRLRLLDLSPLYDKLVTLPSPRSPRTLDVQLPDMTIRFYPVTNDVHCYQFRLKEDAGEPVDAAGRPNSAWSRVRERYDGARYFYFFWVAGDSFEQFRETRDRMRAEGVEVGWKPARRGSFPELCQGLDGAGNPVPQ